MRLEVIEAGCLGPHETKEFAGHVTLHPSRQSLQLEVIGL